MKCNKCGFVNENSSAFCSNCGNVLDGLQGNNSKVSNNKMVIISLVLGILSLVFIFFGRILSIGCAIASVVVGSKAGKKCVGKVLGIISIVVNVLIIVFAVVVLVLGFSNSDFLNRLYNELDYSSSDNYVAGTWNCSKFDGSNYNSNYTITMKLNKDNSFVFGQYGDLSNNHAGGSYTFLDEKDKNEENHNGYKYFNLDLNGNINDYVIDGVSQNREFIGKFEMGITGVNAKKEAILFNYNSYQMYYCKAE